MSVKCVVGVERTLKSVLPLAHNTNFPSILVGTHCSVCSLLIPLTYSIIILSLISVNLFMIHMLVSSLLNKFFYGLQLR